MMSASLVANAAEIGGHPRPPGAGSRTRSRSSLRNDDIGRALSRLSAGIFFKRLQPQADFQSIPPTHRLSVGGRLASETWIFGTVLEQRCSSQRDAALSLTGRVLLAGSVDFKRLPCSGSPNFSFAGHTLKIRARGILRIRDRESGLHSLPYSIFNEAHEPITGIRAGLPMELEVFVGKCLAKDAKDRYDSASDIAKDLRSLGEKLKTGRSAIVKTAVSAREMLSSRQCDKLRRVFRP